MEGYTLTMDILSSSLSRWGLKWWGTVWLFLDMVVVPPECSAHRRSHGKVLSSHMDCQATWMDSITLSRQTLKISKVVFPTLKHHLQQPGIVPSDTSATQQTFGTKSARRSSWDFFVAMLCYGHIWSKKWHLLCNIYDSSYIRHIYRLDADQQCSHGISSWAFRWRWSGSGTTVCCCIVARMTIVVYERTDRRQNYLPWALPDY